MTTKNIVHIQPNLVKETNYEICSKLVQSPFLLRIESFEDSGSVITEGYRETLADQFKTEFPETSEQYVAVESELYRLAFELVSALFAAQKIGFFTLAIQPEDVFVKTNHIRFPLKSLEFSEKKPDDDNPYRAPELSREDDLYDDRVESYSLGVILIQKAFGINNPKKLRDAIEAINISPTQNSNQNIPSTDKPTVTNRFFQFSHDFQLLVSELISPVPQQRPSIQKLLSRPAICAQEPVVELFLKYGDQIQLPPMLHQPSTPLRPLRSQSPFGSTLKSSVARSTYRSPSLGSISPAGTNGLIETPPGSPHTSTSKSIGVSPSPLNDMNDTQQSAITADFHTPPPTELERGTVEVKEEAEVDSLDAQEGNSQPIDSSPPQHPEFINETIFN